MNFLKLTILKEEFLSLKQDIEMVKEELNSEDKFFEKAVITEKFVKKYKNLMIASAIAVVVLVGANIGYTINEQNRVDTANKILLDLEANPKDETAISRLESLSPSLHDVWLYSQAIVDKDMDKLKKLQNSKAILISDLASYELASKSKDIKSLDDYRLKQDAIYRDLAEVQEAIILMNSSKIEEAHQKLSQISVQSPLAKVANALAHYGVK